MDHAESAGYAVGYFESWNLESTLAVADAAERTRSPVILGFSGICLPDEKRVVKDRLSHYAALGRDVCERLTVPACLLFNESAYMPWVLDAIDLGFDLVMFTDGDLDYQQQKARVRQVAERAHAHSVAVEAEITPLPGAGGEMIDRPDQPHLTDPARAAEMVDETGVDALAVDIGQVHLHGHSLLPLLKGEVDSVRDYAFTGHHRQTWSIQDAEWRLLNFIDGSKPSELFHCPSDPYDQTNVIDQHRDVADRMELELWRFVGRVSRI